MQWTMRPAGAIVCFIPVILAGCFSLSRDTPVLEQYVLGGAPVAPGSASRLDVEGFTIGVRRLDLASYLATPSIVVRRGAHQIVVSEFHRWAEDPAGAINRAVARYLATETPVRAVDIAPWPVQARHDYLIQLHVSRFEGVAPAEPAATEGEAHVLASWEISRQQNGAVLARGITDYRERGWRVGDYAGLVTLLDTGLNLLARDLAKCLSALASAAAPVDGGAGTVSEPESMICSPISE